MRIEVDIDLLRKWLRVDFESGELFWLPRGPEDIHDLRIRNTWNTRYAGKPALAHVTAEGYRNGSVAGKRLLTHRVIFAMAHGYYASEIDHIDGNRQNNKLSNLRSVTRSENMRNRRMVRANASGVFGVLKRKGRWIAQIRVEKKYKFLGSFASMDDAISARKLAEEAFGFHQNHGRREIL